MSEARVTPLEQLTRLERERRQIMKAIVTETFTVASPRAPLPQGVISLWQALGRVNNDIDDLLIASTSLEPLPGTPLSGSMGLM